MSVPFKVFSVTFCLRCREFITDNRYTRNDCGCPDHLIPDLAAILGDNVYRSIELTEEGQLVGYVYLGTRKEFKL